MEELTMKQILENIDQLERETDLIIEKNYQYFHFDVAAFLVRENVQAGKILESEK